MDEAKHYGRKWRGHYLGIPSSDSIRELYQHVTMLYLMFWAMRRWRKSNANPQPYRGWQFLWANNTRDQAEVKLAAQTPMGEGEY